MGVGTGVGAGVGVGVVSGTGVTTGVGVGAGVGTGVGAGVIAGCTVGIVVGSAVAAGIFPGDAAGGDVTDGCAFTPVCNVTEGAGEGVATTGDGLAQPVARNDDRIIIAMARLAANLRYI